MKRPIGLACLAVAMLLLVGQTMAAGTDAAALAKKILTQSGTQGGIVVDLGCGDGQLAAALAAGDNFTVHGLAADSDTVAAAREYVRSRGLYGRVSIEQFDGPVLPYTENLINLVVVQDDGQVSKDEILRVLVPEGTACFVRGDKLEMITKPRPDNIDEWSHFLHDATGNAVADDTVVGPPRRVQWIAPPLWLRSHETPSGIEASVTAGGRLFYFFDEGLIGITDERLPDRWSLICRDAFNGRLLWKRPLNTWGWRQWSRERYEGKDWTRLRAARTDVPNENHRRLVAGDERLYVTLDYRGPMSILDAATGSLLTTIDQTDGASEIAVVDDVAVVYTRQVADDVAQRRGIASDGGAALVAVDGRTGRVLWRTDCDPIRPTTLAIDNGRVIYLTSKELAALNLDNGQRLWTAKPKWTSPRGFVAVDDTIVMQTGGRVAAFDAKDGNLLWEKKVNSIPGGEGEDLFVVDGLVWRGITCVDDDLKPVKSSANAMDVGWDLRTGEEKKQVVVENLRSPEHHHRCYRNKATSKFLISSYEGAEFLDFDGGEHGQNNWLRGACRYGMMPANGLLYVPADQCFCQPGGKLLGYAAVKAAADHPLDEMADADRLEKGPAYVKLPARATGNDADWPTLRHDPARHGATDAGVPADVAIDWQVQLQGRLTAPVATDGRLFVAEADAHTLYALDAATGRPLWQFTAGGRIDSPPTIHNGLVLFGSADGRVYCLRAADGELAWRFLAAPVDRRVGYFDQIESAWPVHGSILVADGVAYCTAGRSTYLDGGIRLYGLDPATGKILHKGLLEGPHRETPTDRDLAFFVAGANSDVLVSEGGFLYMRQKKLTPELKEVPCENLSNKGEQDVGLHVFSTSGLLDDSWYNRTFWMYSKRWPGFQLANQAPKAGQLLVVDDEMTYAVRVFYRRNVHSTMFFPGKEGYLLFADLNTNEPQIVGEEGAREPVRWLPQSDYYRGRGDELRELNSEAFGLDKMIGYTRAEPPVWATWLPVRMRAMVKAGDLLFVAGPPDEFDANDPFAPFEGRRGAQLVAVSAADGKPVGELEIGSPPIFDGLIAAGGRLFASLEDGRLISLAGK